MPAASLSFGQYVRAKRLERGLSKTKLAELMGCSPTYISSIESGHVRRPRDRTLSLIAKKLEVPVGDLLAASVGVIGPSVTREEERKLNCAELLTEAVSLSREATRQASESLKLADQYSESMVESVVEIYEKNRALCKTLERFRRLYKGESP